MQNAHLRLGSLEYHRMTEKTSTRIRLRVDRYVGEDEQAHLISVFGNDSDVGAITAAVHEKATFTLTFPDGEVKEVSLGEHASCYKGAVSLQDRKHPVRHLVAVSEALYTNGGVGRTILLGYQRDQAWAMLVSFLGLPAEPSWAEHVLGVVEAEERIKPLDGIGCPGRKTRSFNGRPSGTGQELGAGRIERVQFIYLERRYERGSCRRHDRSPENGDVTCLSVYR